VATLLFCDLVGSTEFGERVDPEAVRDFMSEYFLRMQGAIERHGGAVEKFIGDAVVGVFGVPAAHEDDALRALRAAWDMQIQVSELAKDVERAFGVGISARIGINSGKVVANVAGEDQALVTGDTVNTAARLEQAAAPGAILMGSSTWRLARHAVTAERVQPVAAKGKTEPIDTYRLVAVVPETLGHVKGRAPGFVGREQELRRVEEAFTSCIRGDRSGFIAVVGDAGIGKSRLVSEFLTGIAMSARVIEGKCLSYGDGITYWALAEVIRGLVSVNDDESSDEVLARLNAIAPEDPQAVVHVARAIGLADGTSSTLEITYGVRRLLEHLASRGPLIVVIDDAHWAEPILIELLLDVYEALTRAPVLIIAIARPQFVERWPALPAVVSLDPLSPGEMSEVLQSVLGTQPSEDVESRLLDHAGGNPLFIEELAGMLVETRGSVDSGSDWIELEDAAGGMSIPLTIDALLDSRLDALPEDERLPLECASVEGQLFHKGGVAALLAGDPAHVDRAFARLTERTIVRPATAAFVDEVAFTFRHVLIRDAAYRSAPKKTRAAWHVRLADWLVGKVGRRLGEFEEILGYHLERAHQLRAQLGQLNGETISIGHRGAAHLMSAAERARDRGDVHGALILVGRAEHLLERDDPQLPALLVELGILRREDGDLVGAFETLERAFNLAEQVTDAAVAAHARIEHAFVRIDVDPDSAPAAERDMLDAIDVVRREGDDRRLARALQRLATSESFWGRIGSAEQLLGEASEVLGRLGDRRMSPRIAWSYASFADYSPTPSSEGLRRVDVALEEAAENPRLIAELLLLQAIFLATRGEFSKAEESSARGEASLLELGEDEFTSQIVGETRYRMAQLRGDVEAEERSLRETYLDLKGRGNLGHMASFGCRLGDVLCRLGRISEARPLIDESRQLGADQDIDVQLGWRIAMGRALAGDGRGQEADQIVSEAVAIAEGTDYLLRHADVLMALAEIRYDGGDTDGSATAAQQARTLYARKESIVMAERATALLTTLAKD
jgi:class 3 adenylate cyclase